MMGEMKHPLAGHVPEACRGEQIAGAEVFTILGVLHGRSADCCPPQRFGSLRCACGGRLHFHGDLPGAVVAFCEDCGAMEHR